MAIDASLIETDANKQNSTPTEKWDAAQIDRAEPAILNLILHDGCRIRKGIDWKVTERLFEKRLIRDRIGKAKSPVLTDEGLITAKAALENRSSKS